MTYSANDEIERYSDLEVAPFLDLIEEWYPYLKPWERHRSGDFWFDIRDAQRVVRFIEGYCVHIKGELAGQPMLLDDWQKAALYECFGWKDAAGLRQYRKFWLEIPRKNGKSTLSSGIALYLLLCDREPGAEVYSAAADKDQARIVFNLARDICLYSDELTSRVEVLKNIIVNPDLNAFYKALSSDAFTKHGLNVHGIVVDEVHAQPDRELIDVLTTSTGSRRQPLEVYITTAGYDRNSICWELHDYAQKLIDGALEDHTFLPIVFAASPDDDWTDPAVWRKANPCLGTAKKLAYMEQQCQKAKNIPAYENTFKRLDLNIWTEQDVRWLPMSIWLPAKPEIIDPFKTIGEIPEELLGKSCFCGLDLSKTTDLTALGFVFRTENGFKRLACHYWAPAQKARERSKKDKVPYELWAKNGWLQLTEGAVVDYDVIREHIKALSEKLDIRQILIDRWNSTQLATQLKSDGLEVAFFGQGFASMSNPSKELETLLLAGKLIHDGNPVLTWNYANVSVKTDPAGNIKPDKEKSTDRIDGAVATIMALGGDIADEEENGSVYDTGELTIL